MFDQLYVRPTALSRHLSAPLLQERMAYLQMLADGGWCRDARRQQAAHLLAIVDGLSLHDRRKRCVSVRQVRQAAKCWAKRCPSNKKWTPGPHSESMFLWRAIRWLKFIGRLKPEPMHLSQFESLLKAFDDYMLNERGLSEVAQHERRRLVERFLLYVQPANDSLAKVTADALSTAFDGFARSHGYTRQSIQSIATRVRCFFRWAEMHHKCPPGLTAAICGPRVYSLAALHAPPSWNDVQHLLALTEGDDPRSIRDRAILMLFAVYGLRQSEVTRLRLDDFDWKAERLSVSCSKTRKTRIFPLTRTVGDAVLRYLREARPRSDHREVFLSLQVPFRPVKVLWHTVARRLRLLGVTTAHYGPHILRHACATHLLAQGLSLKQIGDHLGHTCPDTTRIYAKVDLAGLRQVAELDLEGLL
jgi:site-specific recombinase XerD